VLHEYRILDYVLLAFILVELLDTIRIIRQECGIIIAEPFLLVGLRAAYPIGHRLNRASYRYKRVIKPAC
jgi:hypothetical protein